MLGGPRKNSSDMTYGGVYYAEVTNNKDDDASGTARVKVKFPWLSGDDESYWAQMATPLAGNEFGIYFLPEVGDMVAVVFIGGDIRHPIILGGVWNNTDKIPHANDGKNNIRMIKSRSGHRMIFDDGSNTGIVLTDKADSQFIGVGKLGGSEMDASTDASEGVSASASDKLEIWCSDGTFKVDAKDVKINASGDLHVNAGTDCKLTAQAQLKVSGGASGKIKGGTLKVG